MHTRLAIVPLLVLLVGCVAPPRPYWTPETRLVQRLDYAAWDALLAEHVADGHVDYPALAAAAELDALLYQLRKARFTRDTTRDERLAFWMNAYNAAAIAGILDGGSLDGRLGRARFFQRRLWAVGGEEITLWDLERERILAVGGPRALLAIACPAVSCPRLASEALLPERLDAQIEARTRAFVNDPTRNAFDLAEGRAMLSPIFEAHEKAFALAAGSVGAWVARYVDDPQVAAALRAGALEIEYLPWDWSLNGTPVAAESLRLAAPVPE